jgi:hypothetical protein
MQEKKSNGKAAASSYLQELVRPKWPNPHSIIFAVLTCKNIGHFSPPPPSPLMIPTYKKQQRQMQGV